MLASCLQITKEIIDQTISYINDIFETKDKIKSRNEQFRKLSHNLLNKCMKTFAFPKKIWYNMKVNND